MRLAACLAGALGVNALLLLGLALLHRPAAPPRGEDAGPQRHARLLPPPPPEPEVRELPAPEEQPPRRTPQVALEAAAPAEPDPLPPPLPVPLSVAVPVLEILPPALPAPRPSALAREAPGADEVDEPPTVLSGAAPRYPPEALRRSREGSATVRLLLDEEGRVRQAEVVSWEGHPSFAGAVLEAARGWRFTPARHLDADAHRLLGHARLDRDAGRLPQARNDPSSAAAHLETTAAEGFPDLHLLAAAGRALLDPPPATPPSPPDPSTAARLLQLAHQAGDTSPATLLPLARAHLRLQEPAEADAALRALLEHTAPAAAFRDLLRQRILQG